MTSPPFDDVVSFVREFTGVNNQHPITAETWLEADLDVTGDDGSALLEQAARDFDVELATSEAGYRETFNLGPNEYLFHCEGFDLLGITELIRWFRKEPRPIIRDLTVGELHAALVRRRAAARAV